jgi:hypothetical protein
MDLNWMVVAVVHRDDKVKEVAFSHVLRRLLFKLSGNELMVGALSVGGEGKERLKMEGEREKSVRKIVITGL